MQDMVAEISTDRFFADVIDTVETPIAVLDSEGRVILFNSACEKLTGYSADDVLGRIFWEFMIPDAEIVSVKELFIRTREQVEPTQFINHWKTKDGALKLFRWTNKSIQRKDGAVAAVIATAVDLTQLEIVEHTLLETRSFLKSIIDASPEAIISTDECGDIQSFSRAAEKMFEYEAKDIIGKNITLLMPEPHRSQHDLYIKNYLDSGVKKIIGRSREVIAVRSNGEEFPAVLHITEFHDGRRIFVGFVEDSTDKKELEQKYTETQIILQHAGRLAAMGEVATSIAHELNQPLTAAASLAGAVELLLRKEVLQKSTEIFALLNDAVAQIRRASEVIQHLREFVQRKKIAKDRYDINDVVREAAALALIRNDAANIKVNWSLNKRIGAAWIDRIQIQQVVTNLVHNAVDAMQNSEKRELTISTQKSEGIITVTISDSGPGLPDELVGRVFEPFISGKENGMGVGLSISKSIIDAHQGEISAENLESGGCEFTFKLPAGGCDDHTD